MQADKRAFPVHALSIDVEDWHNAADLMITGRVRPPTAAVERFTHLLFELIAGHGVSATWFFLGEVAQKYPSLVRMVAAAGHEVGIHGYHHHRVFELSPAEHAASLRRAKQVVEDLSGQAVIGYRAVAMSIGSGTWHALDAAAEAGFRYDSSLFPFRGPIYGVPDAPVEPHWRRCPAGAWIFEVPLTVLELGPLRLPGCGGGYLRHLPLAYTRMVLAGLKHQRREAVFYVHPYELDTNLSAATSPDGMTLGQAVRFARLRHFQYRNRARTAEKLQWLLTHHRFGPIRDVFAIAERTPPASCEGRGGLD